MLAWQMEGGSGGRLRFEELNSIVSVLSESSRSLFSAIHSLLSDTQVWTAFLVSS